MEGKYWCFTLNNYTEEEENFLKNINCKYIVFGKEVGENGTNHLQGYIEFGSNRKLERLKREISNRAHWEKRRGKAEEAANYCKKDEDYIELGEISRTSQGRRTDLEDVKELVEQGKGMKDIIEVTTSYQSVRYAETLLKYKEKVRSWEPHVVWLWGDTGVGKTKRAYEETTNPYISGKNLKWWEGYDAHEDVIIDDFRKDFCTFHELLRILDRYEYRVEVKGGSRQLLAKKIYITSCYSPDKVYDTREDIDQLLRRINLIVEMRSEMEVTGNTSGDLEEIINLYAAP